MNTFSITVLDRTGTHTARCDPPVSLQPRVKASIAPPRFDHAAIMSAAWVDYRAAARKGWTSKGFDRARWVYCLSFAWSLAKAHLIKSDADAKEAIRLQAIISAVSASIEAPKLNRPRQASARGGHPSRAAGHRIFRRLRCADRPPRTRAAG